MKRLWKKAIASALAIVVQFGTINVPTLYAQEGAVLNMETQITALSETVSGNDADMFVQNETQSIIKRTTDGDDSNVWDQTTTKKVFEGENYKVTFTLASYWDTGYNANIKLENIGDSVIQNWCLQFDYNNSITNIWNAAISTEAEHKYTIKNAGWNQDIAAGSCVEFGISGDHAFRGFPENYELVGASTEVKTEDYTIEYCVESDWESGFTGAISITNNSDNSIEDWVIEFEFDRNITNIWNGELLSHEGTHYVIKNMGYNADVAIGDTVNFGFVGKDGVKEDKPHGYQLYSYNSQNTDSLNKDSDNDGLPDDYEIKYTDTNPFKRDSDENGITDDNEDFDKDGLTNKEELQFKANPYYPDTDLDGINDYDEVKIYGTDPTLMDTDNDKIDDGVEIKFGTNPRVAEELNQDGTVQLVYSPYSDNSMVEVSINICMLPEQVNSFEVDRILPNDSILSDEIPGYLGEGSAYDFVLDGNFARAVLTYTLSNDLIKDSDFVPAIYYYDEDKQLLEELENLILYGNTIEVELKHFSRYILLNKRQYDKVWNYDLHFDMNNMQRSNLDVAFVIDSSGSMNYNDKDGNRKKVTQNFINKLTENDRAAIIDFDSYASVYSGFTNDKSILYEAVDRIDSSGNTNLSAGISTALNLFLNEEYNEDRLKCIVFLTDGSGAYNNLYTKTAKDEEITIYTIGIGSSVQTSVLTDIAQKTGGKYFHTSEGEKLYEIFDSIYELTDLYKDSDMDGLSDYHEKAMARGELRLGTGIALVGVDYLNYDSDGDYKLDGDEIKVEQLGNMVYVKMSSNPTKKDTDNDGVEDNEDPWPLVCHTFEKLENYQTCSEWGETAFDEDADDLETVDNPQKYYDTVVIHHTDRNLHESITSLEQNEVKRDFNGLPYHFIIDGAGNIYEGRPINYKGSHVQNNNTGKIGVALMGNFHPNEGGIKSWVKDSMPTEPTYRQYNALKQLLKVLDTQYGIDYLGGHRDFVVSNPTVCPGDTLYKMLKEDNLIVLPELENKE